MPKIFLTNEDEKRFVKQVNGKTPDGNGNVKIPSESEKSPVVTLNEFSDATGSGVRISVDNPDGSGQVATVHNGEDGTSAFATVTKSGNVVTITTQDATGVHSVSIEIPDDEHINSLINTALGVIENGTY